MNMIILNRYVEEFSFRVVYISGKVFSVVGLIVVVVRDEEFYEFVIEVGVLMLVDNVRIFYIFGCKESRIVFISRGV